MTIKDTCELLKLGLHAEGVDVRDVRLVNNNTFLVEFTARSKGSVDIKTEVGFIIAFVSSFFRENTDAPDAVTSFAAQAFSDEGRSLMHAISSLAAAEHMSKGRSLEWLQNTLFQDHTDEYRQGIAKRQIAELENGLRLLISSVLTAAEGADWWNRRVTTRLRQSTEEMYERAEGVRCQDGDTLIYYTFLLDLKRLVVSNWQEFAPVLASQRQFSDLLDELNLIRRTEAHNRVLSDQELKKLTSIYNELMARIATVEPTAASSFLIDNWRTQLREIFSAAADGQVLLEPGAPVNVALAAVRKQIDQYQDLRLRVSSLVVPPVKRTLHEELESLLGEVISTMEEIVDLVVRMDLKELEAAQLRNQSAHQKLGVFREKFLMSEL